MRRARAALLVAAMAAMPAMAAPASVPPGALSCGGCHAPAPEGAIPSLAGRNAGEIVADMQAFRSGARPATVMDRIAKGFSDEETRAIADWLATTGAGEPAKP